MAQIAKTKPRLIPTQRQLEKALQESANQAQRLAVVFGKKIPTDQSKRNHQVVKVQ
jgi:hypothetical protein